MSSAVENGLPASVRDKASIALARDVFRLLSRAVTSLKLFPPRHATVLKFEDDLSGLIEAYFADHQELEVEVREHAFLVDDEVILEEENITRSLPYFFHKDGMRKFAILKGIDKQELHEFLHLIRQTSLLPLDESDVVTSIWEKDFANIRIVAPDEHLLSKIDVFARKPLVSSVDTQGLYAGRVDLSVDDLKDIQAQRLTLGLIEQEEPGREEASAEMAKQAEEEKEAIEDMLAESRRVPPEVEFHHMIFELLSLEDRPERVASILAFLEVHYRTLAQEGKFVFAVQFLNLIKELSRLCAGTKPEKAAQLDTFVAGLDAGLNTDLLRDLIRAANFDSLPALLQFLAFRGARAVPLAIELLEEAQDAETRRAAAVFIEKIAGNDLDLLASQLQDQRPAITKEIIALLGRSPNRKSLGYLAPLTSYSNKDIRLAAVDALGASTEPLARRILATLVQDEDEEVARSAVERLRWGGDTRILERILELAASRKFAGSGPRLKTALFGFLVETGSPEALGAIRRLLEKRHFFSRPDRLASQLCAVEALAAAAPPEASEILRRGLKASNKTLREACRKALESGNSAEPAAREDKR